MLRISLIKPELLYGITPNAPLLTGVKMTRTLDNLFCCLYIRFIFYDSLNRLIILDIILSKSMFI